MSRLIAYTVPELDNFAPWVIAKEALSGRIQEGASVAKLERMFAEYVGTKYALAFPSARAALFSCYNALGCYGKAALLPAYTCIPAIDAARWAGARPHFLDIGLEDYNPRFSSRLSREKNIGAISLSYLYGMMGDIQPFLDFAKDENIPIVEDSAIALGASYGGRKAGAMGDAGVFSLQESKIITGWRGGIVTTNSREIFEKISAMRVNARTPCAKLLFNLSFSYFRRLFSKPTIYKPTMYAFKRFMTSGPMVGTLSKIMSFNPLESIDAESPEEMPECECARLSNIQASVALLSMKRIEKIVARRRHMARMLSHELESCRGLSFPKEEGKARHAWGRFPARIEGIEKWKVMLSLFKKGIETSPNYPYITPLTGHMKVFKFNAKDYPNAIKASRETFLLPFHTLISDKEIGILSDALRKVASELR